MNIDPDTLEKEILREWEDPEIRSEFVDFKNFRAYKLAEAKGLVKFEPINGVTIDKMCEILSKHPYNTLTPVRNLANRVRNQKAGKARSPAKTRGKEIYFNVLDKGQKPPSAKKLCRLLEAEGFKVKLTAVKNWPAEFKKDYFSRQPVTGK